MHSQSAARAFACSLLALATLAGCWTEASAPARTPARRSVGTEASSARDVTLAELRDFERSRREATDFALESAPDGAFGADPYRLIAVGDGRFIGVLRGSSTLVLLDGELTEQARAPAPRRPTGAARASGGSVLVVGELEASIRRYRVDPGLEALAPIETPGVVGWSAIIAGPGDSVYAVSESSSELFVIENASTPAPRVLSFSGLGQAARALAYAPGHVVVNCLLDHELVVIPLDAAGRPRGARERTLPPDTARIAHDGPFWGLGLARRGDRLLIAATGVEDHPLDRSPGSFGYIDSFLYLYEVDSKQHVSRRLELDTSEQGVVTPKAVTLKADVSTIQIHLSAYGSAAGLELSLRDDFSVERLVTEVIPPGSASVLETPDGRLVAANPLLDAWTLESDAGVHVEPVNEPRDRRKPLEKLGEALMYTTLIAPENHADGALSRFTCEACHFEGYVDGRTHHTGRGDVRATTKPLIGLFNNRPYFSRALDRDLTQMVHNEFRVAGANSGHDPWFALSPDEHPWLAQLGIQAKIAPEALRRALMTHLMRSSHAPNPLAQGRAAFDADEALGAQVFAGQCEGCHQARLDTGDASSRAPFERWPSLVFSPAGPLVWASDVYAKTGIEPYVHERGARVPSLRRLAKKYPYFTNGSSPSIADVLARVRVLPSGFSHAGSETSRTGALSAEERRALEAFLRLL
jgi:hypothetical protein